MEVPLSEYELLRLARMAQYQEVLANLGLSNSSNLIKSSEAVGASGAEKSPKKRGRKRKEPSGNDAAPVESKRPKRASPVRPPKLEIKQKPKKIQPVVNSGPPVKRKRGRPRKIRPEETAKTQAAPAAPPPKKPPTPKKPKRANQDSDLEAEVSIEGGDDEDHSNDEDIEEMGLGSDENSDIHTGSDTELRIKASEEVVPTKPGPNKTTLWRLNLSKGTQGSQETVSGDPKTWRVAFAGLSSGQRKELHDLVSQLNSHTTKSIQAATHLVTSRICRKTKFVIALSKNLPILSTDWITKSVAAGHWLKYLLKDEKGEKELGLELAVSVSRAKEERIFAGRYFMVAPDVYRQSEVTSIVVNAGALVAPYRANREPEPPTVLIVEKEGSRFDEPGATLTVAQLFNVVLKQAWH